MPYVMNRAAVAALSLLVPCGLFLVPAPAVRAQAESGPPAVPPRAEWRVSASSVENDSFPAAFACDDGAETRWSSAWNDPEWLQIDMGRPARVCGLTLSWENAFGSAYEVAVSEDGEAWRTVCRTEDGDGQVDELYFRPVLARFVRIVGLRRATSWGYSLWDVHVKGEDECPRVETETAAGSDPGDLFDGRLDTVWSSAVPAPVSLIVDFGRAKDMAGLRVDWGANHATDVRTLISADGTNWTEAARLEEGTGRFDYLMFPPSNPRYVRLEMVAGARPAPIEIREITLRGPNEKLCPDGYYAIAAEKARPGQYPEWLRKRQTYWTLVGLPADTRESLLDEYGNLEPFHGSVSLMPYLWSDGQLWSALDADDRAASLDTGRYPIPSVTWSRGGLGVTVTALAAGTVTDAVTYVSYELLNRSGEQATGTLYVAIRPLQINPPWHQGGLAPIRSAEFVDRPAGAAARINGEDRLVALTPPAAAGIARFSNGDILRQLDRGVLPPSAAASDEQGFLSAAWAFEFDLAPGSRTGVVIAAPLHGTLDAVRGFAAESSSDEAFERLRDGMRDTWRTWVERVGFELGDRRITDTLWSQLAYILINRDGPALQPGSRNYKRSWIRDGAMTSTALLRFGFEDEVREYLEWYGRFVEPDGLVHHIMNSDGTVSHLFTGENEWDSQGEYVHAVMQFYRFTKDRAFLESHFERMVRALLFLGILREQTLDSGYMEGEPGRERFAGLLPKSISHEGYIPAVHSYWDDFWALRGWKDGREAAEVLGRDDIAEWADRQYELLRDALAAAVRAAINFHGIDYVPGCAEKGDFDPTSTAIAFRPCDEVSLLPERELRETFDRFYDQLRERRLPGWTGQFVPYEIRSVLALFALDEKERAIELLEYLLSCHRPPGWNHWVELYVSDERAGTYIGDMPHTWVGSGFVNTVREMVVAEKGDRLRLFAGAPEGWLRGSGIELRRLPTLFGPLTVAARLEEGKMTVRLDEAPAAPGGIEIVWPLRGAPREVTFDGADVTDRDAESCRIPARPGELVVRW